MIFVDTYNLCEILKKEKELEATIYAHCPRNKEDEDDLIIIKNGKNTKYEINIYLGKNPYIAIYYKGNTLFDISHPFDEYEAEILDYFLNKANLKRLTIE